MDTRYMLETKCGYSDYQIKDIDDLVFVKVLCACPVLHNIYDKYCNRLGSISLNLGDIIVIAEKNHENKIIYKNSLGRVDYAYYDDTEENYYLNIAKHEIKKHYNLY